MASSTLRGAALLAGLVLLAGCSGFKPVPLEQVAVEFQRQTDRSGALSVSVAVPSARQSAAIYGVDLASEQIQAVWLEVDNQGSSPVWLLPSGIDPNYFAPGEAAFAFHRQRNIRDHAAIDRHFKALAFPWPVAPGSRETGFVLTNLDDGVKVVDVDLLSSEALRSLSFVVEVPGFRADYAQVNIDALYPAQQIQLFDELDELRTYLTSLPCCATNKKGSALGDPLNVVLIGRRADIFSALLRRNWHVTERVWTRSLARTTTSFFSGSRYRYSPVSPLYLYGRKQDISLQKTRSSIHERNHMRLWSSPIRFRGEEVWVGQISRDIGVKFTLKSPTISTHRIDPDVDDARSALLEDLLYSQSASRIGAVEGVGKIPFNQPRENLVGDPWYSDGLRVVLFFDARPLGIDDISLIEEWPVPARSAPGYSPDYLASARYRSAAGHIDSELRPRMQTQSSTDVTVSALLSNSEQSRAILGIDPLDHAIQAVWIEVSNRSGRAFSLMQAGLDPDYVSPVELAHLYRKKLPADEHSALEQHLQALDFHDPIEPGATVSGFVFVNAFGRAGRVLDVDLVGHQWARSFTFILPPPGSTRDIHQLNADSLLPGHPLIEIDNEAQLREAVQQLPCCASLEAGDLKGEPLNLVLIGDAEEIMPGFGRRGYRNAVLEDRFTFSRRQDLEGLRQSQWVDSQPHAVRLWLTPLVYQGKPVWLGQTSNRRGGRFTEVTAAGQAALLDPDTDEARVDMAQDLAYSQAVNARALSYGAGRGYLAEASSDHKPLNYITDGKRAVLFFTREPIALDQIRLLDW